jgi:cytochrome c-type biogenesis protein CcmE
VNEAIKPKHQRLILVLAAMAALIAAALMAAWALRNQASYFYLPAEMASHPPTADRAVRLGGMVQKGSLKTAPDGLTIHFLVSDGTAQVPVTFTGITPDLFKEGSGVVAEGHRRVDGTFVADNLLAKHDEKYVPREMQQMSNREAHQKVAATK